MHERERPGEHRGEHGEVEGKRLLYVVTVEKGGSMRKDRGVILCSRSGTRAGSHHEGRCSDEQLEYHMDNFSLGDEHGERLTVVMVIERYTQMKKAVVVSTKGRQGAARHA